MAYQRGRLLFQYRDLPNCVTAAFYGEGLFEDQIRGKLQSSLLHRVGRAGHPLSGTLVIFHGAANDGDSLMSSRKDFLSHLIRRAPVVEPDTFAVPRLIQLPGQHQWNAALTHQIENAVLMSGTYEHDPIHS